MVNEKPKDIIETEVPQDKGEMLAALDPETLGDAVLENSMKLEEYSEVRKQYDACLALKERSGFKNVPSTVDGAIQISRSAVNIAFIKKEKAEHPERNFLKELYDKSIGSQDFLNFLVHEEGLYFDAKGEPVGLEAYLQDHYKELVGDDVTIKISDGSIKEFPHLSKDEAMAEEAREVANREKSGLPMPVLEIVDAKRGRTTRIPMIANQEYLKKGGLEACYRYVNTGEGPIKQDIVVHPLQALGEERPSLIEHMASLVHEIDHAVYDTLHESDSRAIMQGIDECAQQSERLRAATKGIETEDDLKAYEKLMDNNSDRLTKLRHKQLVSDSADQLGKVMVFEGLARRSEDLFMERQFRALARFDDDPETFTQAASFVRGRQQLVDRSHPGFAIYGAGDILVEAALKQGGSQELYRSNVLEKGIVKQPRIVGAALRRLSIERELINGQSDNPVREYVPELDRAGYESMVKSSAARANIDTSAFLLGEEYYRLLDETNDKVESMDDAAVASRLVEIVKEDPGAMEQFKYALANNPGEGERKILLGLEIIYGQIGKRVKEEWAKVYASEK